MAVPLGKHSGSDLKPTYRCVARFETRGRLEWRQYPRSQQVGGTYSGL